MKLKSIAKIGLIISVFFVVSAIFINFDLVPNINTFTETSRDLVNDLSEQSNAINLSVNTLGIASQTDEKFFMSFLNEQIIHLNRYNFELIETLNSLKVTLIEINQISINRHLELINSMLIDINTITALSSDLEMILSTESMTFDNLEAVVLDIKANLNMIDTNVDLLNTRIIQDMTILLNVTVIILISIITILLLGVFHLVNHLLPNIIRSLKVMSSSDILNQSVPSINTYYNEAETIKKEIFAIIDEKKFIVELQNKLLDVYVVEDTMSVLFDFLKTRLGIDRIGLAYVDYQSKTFVAEYGVLNNKDAILGPGFVQPFEKTSLSSILIHQQPVINNDIEKTLIERPDSEAINMLNKEQIRSNLTIPIIMNQVVFGFIFFSSFQKNFFTDLEIEIGQRVANEVKPLLHRAYFTNVILTKMTSAFSEIVESKDNDTGDHIIRMVKYSTVIARKIKSKNHPNYQMSEKTILEVERYAAVHDIGKVGIPDEVLKKDSILSDEEWQVMKKHPQIGGDVFKNLREALNAFDSSLYQVAENITRYHHERWDGKGYPYGLKEHEIPLVARIVSVADVFDALTSKRSYKQAFTFEESIQIIKEAANSQLDPFVVEVFIEEIENIKEVYSRFN